MHFLEFEFSDGGPLSLITITLHAYVPLTLECCFLYHDSRFHVFGCTRFFSFYSWNLFSLPLNDGVKLLTG